MITMMTCQLSTSGRLPKFQQETIDEKSGFVFRFSLGFLRTFQANFKTIKKNLGKVRLGMNFLVLHCVVRSNKEERVIRV